MNFDMNHAPCAGTIARPVDQQSSALSLYHGCPLKTCRVYFHNWIILSEQVNLHYNDVCGPVSGRVIWIRVWQLGRVGMWEEQGQRDFLSRQTDWLTILGTHAAQGISNGKYKEPSHFFKFIHFTILNFMTATMFSILWAKTGDLHLSLHLLYRKDISEKMTDVLLPHRSQLWLTPHPLLFLTRYPIFHLHQMCCDVVLLLDAFLDSHLLLRNLLLRIMESSLFYAN